MVKITEELVRKRSEHNEGEIFSLEEITLHQQDIEKIEFLDKFCKKLKIVYLQNNLISKIENVGRLKDLEYLNLALNNIERIENLENCESLKKLDLTVNFIGDLFSIENLQNLENFNELYLTGNPCTEFSGYREYVIASLPQLKVLDGKDVSKSERIIAFQNFHKHHTNVVLAQRNHFSKREVEKKESLLREQKFEVKLKNSNGDIDSLSEEFWNQKHTYTPESRMETHKFKFLQKNAKETYSTNKNDKKVKRKVFFAPDGRPYNINEAKLDFKLNEEIENEEHKYLLDIAFYKYMDSSFIECDVQANYVRVTYKLKTFQIALPDEIHPDLSKAMRSQVTGHLLITMPKVQHSTVFTSFSTKKATEKLKKNKNQRSELEPNNRQYLEVTDVKTGEDWKNIVDLSGKNKSEAPVQRLTSTGVTRERSNSPDFVDNVDVPPLI